MVRLAAHNEIVRAQAEARCARHQAAGAEAEERARGAATALHDAQLAAAAAVGDT